MPVQDSHAFGGAGYSNGHANGHANGANGHAVNGHANGAYTQAAASTSTGRPNILFVMADQLAAPQLRMYNENSQILTPNLDRLARDAVVLDSAYCNSPLCAPSRMALVTGQLPSKIGSYDNAASISSDLPTYAHYLRSAGIRDRPCRQDALYRRSAPRL